MIELKLKNYRRFVKDPSADEEFHRIAFEPGLTIITGPNGVGKTTLVEALGYGLYGTKLARLRKKDVAPDNAVGPTEVILDLEIDNQPVRVRRESNLAELWVDNTLQVQGGPRSISAVQRQLSELLGGLAPQQFEHTYFARQGDTAGLVDAKPGSRRTTIAQILQLDILEAAVEIQQEQKNASLQQVRAQGRVVSDELGFSIEKNSLLEKAAKARTVDSRLKHIGSFQSCVENSVLERKTQAENEAEVLTQIENQVTEIKTECSKSEEERDQAAAGVEGHKHSKEKHDQVDREIQTLRALQDRAQEEVRKLDERIRHAEECKEAASTYETLSAQVAECNERLNRLPMVEVRDKELKTAYDRVASLKGELEGLSAVDQQLAEAQEKESTEKRRWDALQADPTTANREAWQERKARLSSQEDEVRKALETLHKSSDNAPCPTCDRPLDQHKRQERLDHLNRWLESELADQRAETEKEKSILDSQQEAWQEEKDEAFRLWNEAQKAALDAQSLVEDRDRIVQERSAAMERLKDAQEAWDELGESKSYDPEEKERVRERSEALEQQIDQVKEDANLYNRLSELRVELQERQKEVQGHTQDIEKRLAEQVGIGYDEDAHEKAIKALSEAEETFSAVQEELHNVELKIVECKSDTEKAQQAFETAVRLQSQLEEDIAQFLRDHQLFALLSDFQDHFFKANTEQVSQRASELILHAVEDGSILGVEFDENGNLHYLDASSTRRLVTDTRPSGGEKALIGLCLRIALAEQAQSIARAGKLRFLVLDEVLSSLDDERRDAVQRIFEDVQQRGVFDHIIMITHLDAVKQGWQAPRLEVRKTGTKTSEVILVDSEDYSDVDIEGV